MEVFPSTTGNDPVAEDLTDGRTVSSDSGNQKPPLDDDFAPSQQRTAHVPGKLEPVGKKKQPRKLVRKDTRNMTEEEKLRQKELDRIKPPSAWNVYCAIITFWAPDFVLQCFGMPARAQRRAWREKCG